MMNSNNKAKILVTGGHLTPAIAVITELKKRGYQNFRWVGHKYNQAGNKMLSPEFQTIKMLDIDFVNLKTGKIIRSRDLKSFIESIKQLFLIFWGLIRSFFIILSYRPAIVLSFGGYLAVPIVFWAKIFRIKIITHEQTIVTGSANKFIAKLANKVLISWENSRKYFNPQKTILTGNPIRRDIFKSKSETLTSGFNKDFPTLLIYAGNQGSHEINFRVFEIIKELLQDFNVIHQTGNSTVTNDFNKAKEIRNSLNSIHRDRYTVRDYILPNEIGEALNKSDIILSRAGANSISEILALGKISILIPIPWASHDEQTKNAELVASTGLGYILKQKESLTPQTLFQTILLANNQLRSGLGFNNKPIDDCKEIAKGYIILDAPSKVADEVENLLK